MTTSGELLSMVSRETVLPTMAGTATVSPARAIVRDGTEKTTKGRAVASSTSALCPGGF